MIEEYKVLFGAFVSGFLRGLWLVAKIVIIFIIILIVLGVAL